MEELNDEAPHKRPKGKRALDRMHIHAGERRRKIAAPSPLTPPVTATAAEPSPAAPPRATPEEETMHPLPSIGEEGNGVRVLVPWVDGGEAAEDTTSKPSPFEENKKWPAEAADESEPLPAEK